MNVRIKSDKILFLFIFFFALKQHLNQAQAFSKPIRIALKADIQSFDPRFSVDADSQYLEDLIHCSLVAFNPNGEPTPRLATRWKWQQPTLLEVHISEDFTFSDGKKVSPEDVLANLKYYMKKNSTSPRSSSFKNVAKVEKSEKRILIHLIKPEASFIMNLSFGILPKISTLAERFSRVQDLPPTCGPYALTQTAHNRLKLTRKQNQVSQPSPRPQTIEFITVKEESTRMSKVLANQVDIVQNGFSFDKLKTVLKRNKKVKILKRSGLNTRYIGINFKDPILSNPSVRRAISQAIDRQKIIRLLLDGQATPATGMLYPLKAFRPTEVRSPESSPHDLKQALEKAGYKVDRSTKVRFTLSLLTSNDQSQIMIAKAIASMLSKVDIRLKVVSREWGSFKQTVDKGRAQLWLMKWVGYKDPDILNYIFSSESIPPAGANRGFYQNPSLDQVLKEAKTETDPKRRRNLYLKAEEIVSAELPYIFLWHENITAIVSSRAEGFRLYADGRYSSLLQN